MIKLFDICNDIKYILMCATSYTMGKYLYVVIQNYKVDCNGRDYFQIKGRISTDICNVSD